MFAVSGLLFAYCLPFRQMQKPDAAKNIDVFANLQKNYGISAELQQINATGIKN